MKINNRACLFVLSLVIMFLLQGCTPTLPIKKIIAEREDILACVTARNSQGICKSASENKAIVQFSSTIANTNDASITGTNYHNDYFNALNKIERDYSTLTGKVEDLSNCNGKKAIEYSKFLSNSDTNSKLRRMIENLLTGKNTDPQSPSILFDKTDINAFIDNTVIASQNGSVQSLQCVIEKMKDDKKTLTLNSVEEATYQQIIDELKYIDAYLIAYFSHGRFISGSLELSDIINKIKKHYAKELPDNENDKNNLISEIFKNWTGKEIKYGKDGKIKFEGCGKEEIDAKKCKIKIDFSGQKDSSGFVARSGATYSFPNITLKLDPLSKQKISTNEIDWNNIAGQLFKVIIEGIGDSITGLPGVKTSTLCSKFNVCYQVKDNKNDKDKFNLDEESFGSVNEYADKIDTGTSAVAGALIRFAGPMALNNETIAKMIQSVLGSVAKKAAEKVFYCAYSCISAEIDEEKEIKRRTTGEDKLKMSLERAMNEIDILKQKKVMKEIDIKTFPVQVNRF